MKRSYLVLLEVTPKEQDDDVTCWDWQFGLELEPGEARCITAAEVTE